MKVLHVSSGNLYGGVEALLATLSRERACCPEMEPVFALCFQGRLSDQLAGLGTPAADLGSVQTRYPWQIWRARRRLARRLREQPVDVVVCHLAWAHAIFGPVARRARLPLVYWMHDVAEGKHWIERWAARCPPDLAICNSRFTAGSLAKLFPWTTPPQRVIFYPVSKPATATEDRAAIRAVLDTPVDACVLIQVSRMEPYKGAALHLDALALLADVPGWVCWMVGGCSDRTKPPSWPISRPVPRARGSPAACVFWARAKMCPPCWRRRTCSASPTCAASRSASCSLRRCMPACPSSARRLGGALGDCG